jgi:rhodanese-related sulfurtransferase
MLIEPVVAFRLLRAGAALFVDVRAHEDLARDGERIPGAIHLDPECGEAVDAAIESLSRERSIVVYCDEPGDASALAIAGRARAGGVAGASVLRGGLIGWRAAGLPTERIERREDELPVSG